MRLVLNLDAPWVAAQPSSGEVLAFARADLPARLATTPLFDAKAPPERVAAPGEQVTLVGETEARSTLGWTVRIVERLITSGGTARRELEARYSLLEVGASAVVSGPAEVIAQHREALLAAALGGRPDWRREGEISCVAELLPAK